jgi:sulfur-oxidizing protein SoxY
VTYAGKPIMSADVDFSVSENPNFRFYFTPRTSGQLAAVAEDSNDVVFKTSLAVKVQ